jgi:hypothetical protein
MDMYTRKKMVRHKAVIVGTPPAASRLLQEIAVLQMGDFRQ